MFSLIWNILYVYNKYIRYVTYCSMNAGVLQKCTVFLSELILDLRNYSVNVLYDMYDIG